MLHRYLAAVLVAVWWVFPPAAKADCSQMGTLVNCTAIDFDGFLSPDSNLTLSIEPDALVRNFQTTRRRGNCPLSLPAISIGNSSTVTNAGTIQTFGVCATGIEVGDFSTVTNDGLILTDDILALGIAAGDNATVVNKGQIRTSEIIADGIFVDDDSQVTNTENASIETDGINARGINGRDNVSITNTGLIRTTGQGSHGIDVLEGSVVVNAGRVEVSGFQAAGIRAREGIISVTNTGSIEGTYAGNSDPNNREDGIQASGSSITVMNTGSITMSAPLSAAIRLDLEGSGSVTVSNSGLLSAPNGGLIVNAPRGQITALNSGIIRTSGLGAPALFLDTDVTGQTSFTNTGQVIGVTGGLSLLAGSGRDDVVNRGRLTGRIALGGGDDRLTLQSGSELDAAGQGGALDGGQGFDELILSGSGTLNSSVNGFEELTRFGAGTWVLSQDLDAADRIRIIEGDLVVDADTTLSSSEITIFSEGVLRLAGTATGSLINSGSLQITRPTSINGSFTQTETGRLSLTLTDIPSAIMVSVGGPADVSGRLDIDLTGAPLIRDRTEITILAAEETSDSLPQVTVTGSGFLTAVPTVTPGALRVRFDRMPFASAAQSPNARSLAGALDAALDDTSNSDLALLKSVDTLSQDAARDALSNLVSVLPIVLVQLDLLAARNALEALTSAASRHDEPTSMWGQIGRLSGSFADRSGDRFNHHHTAVNAGVSYAWADRHSAGLSLSQVESKAKLKIQTAQAAGTTTFFGARYSYDGDSWLGSAAVLVGDLDGTTARLGGLDGSTALTGDGGGRTTALSGQLRRALEINSWHLETEIGLSLVDINRDAIAEAGGTGTSLAFGQIDEKSLRADISMSSTIALGELTPTVLLGLSHELNSVSRDVEAALTDLPSSSFTLSLRPEERTWVTWNIEVPFRPGDNVDIRLNGGGVANDKTGGHYVTLTASLAL